MPLVYNKCSLLRFNTYSKTVSETEETKETAKEETAKEEDKKSGDEDSDEEPPPGLLDKPVVILYEKRAKKVMQNLIKINYI